MHGDLGMIGKEDIVLESHIVEKVKNLFKFSPFKRFNIPLIAMAKMKNLTLAKYADILLIFLLKRRLSTLILLQTSSTTLTMAMGDALAVCLMKKEILKRRFCIFHPGGSLGKKLL